MPSYCKIETNNQGQLFKNCSSKKIAGRHANTAEPLDEDFSLALEHSIFVENLPSNHMLYFNFDFHITSPAYGPAVAQALNVMNNKDTIKELTFYTFDSHNGRGILTNKITAKNGLIRMATTNKEHIAISGSGLGELTMAISFEELIFEDLVNNSTGYIKTTS